MSDARVLRSIELMESWLRNPEGMPNADEMAVWNREFQSAVIGAERGPGWTNLIARAHALGAEVNGRTAELVVQRDQLRGELDTHERGGRALKGYGAATR